jgi:hypothetical protein
MLRSLPFAGFRVILFPCKACFLPAFKDGFDEVEAKAAVEVFGFFLVWAGSLCIFLVYG